MISASSVGSELTILLYYSPLPPQPHELVFPAYNEGDILAILECRVGKKIVDYKALQLISRRVAASSGDARQALEITSNDIGKCLA